MSWNRWIFLLLITAIIAACKEDRPFEQELVGRWEVIEQVFSKRDTFSEELVNQDTFTLVFNADETGQLDQNNEMIWAYLADQQRLIISFSGTSFLRGYTFSVAPVYRETLIWEEVILRRVAASLDDYLEERTTIWELKRLP